MADRMKVLLTGANGFVGSHILDRLRAAGIATRLLLRARSDTRFIHDHLAHVEVERGGLDDPAALGRAAAGVTHVLHCAGATKALTPASLESVNRVGTRTVVEAVNAAPGPIARLVVLSSLAAAGPGTWARPRGEADPPAPVSEYGRSKLAGEGEIVSACHREFVILRPCGVYGPRDLEFLRLFRAARARLTPLFGGGRQELSLVFAPDLAEVAVRALTAPLPDGVLVNVASPEVVTAAEFARADAAASGRRTLPLPIPLATLRLICVFASAWARLTGRPTILAHGKERELQAPGWVADTSRLQQWLGPVCRTGMNQGLAATHAWYREAGWL